MSPEQQRKVDGNAMDNIPRTPSQSATFRRDEIEVACAMFNKASTGGDITILQRSEAGKRLHRQFLVLRARLHDERAQGPGA